MHENSLRFIASYLKARYREERSRRRLSVVSELGSFTGGLLRRKVRAAFDRW